MAPADLLARGGYTLRLEEFDTSRGRIAKTVVRHQDDWVLFNLRRLRRELDPAGFAAERGALQSREASCGAASPSPLPWPGSTSRPCGRGEQVLAAELAGLEARLADQARALGPASGLDRMAEIAAAAASADAAARDEGQRLVGAGRGASQARGGRRGAAGRGAGSRGDASC